MSNLTLAVRPDRSKLYGITHETDGTPRTKQVRAMKVGIGVPVGKDVHVFINQDNKWCVATGVYGAKREEKTDRFDTKEEAWEFYIKARKNAPERKYPRKLGYFTFLHLAGDGIYIHDFDAIEAHGPLPTEIDIGFIVNDPFESAYQWWTAAELKCEGDGITARRRLALAEGEVEKELAAEAAAGGEKFFPIIDGCATKGCTYCRGDRPVCKPHGRLNFQLAKSQHIALGGTCTFDTTGFRSISQIFSCIRQIKTATGRGNPDRGFVTGIPLKFVLRPYRTSHDGKPAIQYGVSLEFRAENTLELAKQLNTHAASFQRALNAAPGELVTELDEEEIIGADALEGAEGLAATEEDLELEAKALTAEFYGEFGEDEEEGAHIGTEQEPIRRPQRRSEATSTKKATTKTRKKPEGTTKPKATGTEKASAGTTAPVGTASEKKDETIVPPGQRRQIEPAASKDEALDPKLVKSLGTAMVSATLGNADFRERFTKLTGLEQVKKTDQQIVLSWIANPVVR